MGTEKTKPSDKHRLGDTCAEAGRLLTLDRQADYGPPACNYGRAAAIMEAMTGGVYSATEMVMVMIAVKLARECGTHKGDNLVDLAAYADIWAHLEDSPNV